VAVAAFQPTLPPPGRLVRLGVVLDSRNPAARLTQIAAMCDRAGIGAIWADAWPTLTLLAPTVERARLGAVVPAGLDVGGLLAGVPADRLELTVRDASARSLRAILAAAPEGARPRLAAELADDQDPAPLLAVVDDLLLAAGTVEGVLAAAASVRRTAAAAGREPRSLGVAARLPVSVGRTVAEAAARWQAEPAFAALGAPQEAAIFGTLEQCHERVIALAHAGVTDLRCVLPNAADVHDVIAQLTAMTVGTVDKLAPGAPRSPAPPPPPGWGGRPRFPTGSPSPRT
jgi:hypothetical protein